MTTRVLLLPGGTAIGSVALAHAGLHKIIELHEEHMADPHHPAPHTVAVLRDPALVPPSTLRGAALTPEEVFPDLAPVISTDPHFFDGIDLVIETSGSTMGVPRRVGLSIEAIVASIDATHTALDGPGTWIQALPAHHVAGAMTLLRSTRHDFPPRIVDTSQGFDPRALLPAIRGAHTTGSPAYLSLVPAQLSCALDDHEVTAALATLNAVLVGGQIIAVDLLERAQSAGINIHTSYGMSETCGGIAYDGLPLKEVRLRLVDVNEAGHGRLAISGPTLMTRYLDGQSPWISDDNTPWTGQGQRWLLTNDLATISANGKVSILGRSDDVLISGGKNILPAHIEEALRALPGINDVCVVGLSDPLWGDRIGAAIVAQGGYACDEATFTQIYQEISQRLGKHCAPRVICTVEQLPVLPSGKIDRRGTEQLVRVAQQNGSAWLR